MEIRDKKCKKRTYMQVMYVFYTFYIFITFTQKIQVLIIDYIN